MRYLYTLVAYLLAPIFCGVLWFHGFRDRRYWRNFGERFGRGATLEQPSIWVHAVSVGEVQAAAVLVRCLHDRYPGIPLVVTTLTPTGGERARAVLGDRALVRYLPLDLPGSVRRFFDKVRPRIAVIFETELWPNLYHECGRRRVPLVLASARISPRRARTMRHVFALSVPTRIARTSPAISSSILRCLRMCRPRAVSFASTMRQDGSCG
jgi:3-deoxy-D-manno-octulosonic-acid transferase